MRHRAWLVVFGGLFGLVALIGFYDALREVGPVLIIAPIAGAVGMTLVTISHAVPIAMAYELVPAYVDANASTQESLASISRVWQTISARPGGPPTIRPP